MTAAVTEQPGIVGKLPRTHAHPDSGRGGPTIGPYQILGLPTPRLRSRF